MARTKQAARKLGNKSAHKQNGKQQAASKKDLSDLPFARTELATLQQMLDLISAQGLDASLRNAVFICIDCEAFEFSPNKITEIGISVLDTSDLSSVAPGEDAEAAWLGQIKSAHYRPIQYAKYRNKRWIRGCEHGFNFGVTKWINVDDAPKLLARVLADPTQMNEASNFDTKMAAQARNIVLVGHDLKNDDNFLKHLGFSLSEGQRVAHTFDTAKIARAATGHDVGLHRLLLSLGMKPVNLHNGGNDAAYTLQALILMAFQDHGDPGSVFSGLAAQPKELPDLEYNNQAAPHVYAGSVKVDKLDANTKHIVNEACKVPNAEIYRNVKKPAAKAKGKAKVSNTSQPGTGPNATSANGMADTAQKLGKLQLAPKVSARKAAKARRREKRRLGSSQNR